jgi:hypothetical protein
MVVPMAVVPLHCACCCRCRRTCRCEEGEVVVVVPVPVVPLRCACCRCCRRAHHCEEGEEEGEVVVVVVPPRCTCCPRCCCACRVEVGVLLMSPLPSHAPLQGGGGGCEEGEVVMVVLLLVVPLRCACCRRCHRAHCERPLVNTSPPVVALKQILASLQYNICLPLRLLPPLPPRLP